MLYAKYQGILASGSWEDFWRFVKIFMIVPLIGPQKGPVPLFEQSPYPKHVSYQVWLKLDQWFLRKCHLKENLRRTDDGRWAMA